MQESSWWLKLPDLDCLQASNKLGSQGLVVTGRRLLWLLKAFCSYTSVRNPQSEPPDLLMEQRLEPEHTSVNARTSILSGKDPSCLALFCNNKQEDGVVWLHCLYKVQGISCCSDMHTLCFGFPYHDRNFMLRFFSGCPQNCRLIY